MDLMDLKPQSDLVNVTLVHPNSLEVLLNEDKSEMTITLYAPHSKEYKAVVHEQTNKRLKKAQGNGKLELTAEEIEESTLNLLCKVTKEWNITYGKESPKLTLNKAKEVYTDVFWIKDQLDRALTESVNFMKA